MLDLYFEKLPPEAFTMDKFYYKPCSQPPKDSWSPWFTTNPIGKNTLANMVKVMSKDADIKEHKTNHSLRATGAAAMYQAGLPEKAIQERTCHMSITGLCHYERTNTEQQKAISKVLASSETSAFREHYFEHCRVVQAPSNPANNFLFANCQVNIYTSSSSHSNRSALSDVTNRLP